MSRRSSAARSVGATVLEDTEQLLGRTDERIGLLGEQALVRMDAAPADGDREDARSLRGADVERRVADVDGLVGRTLELLDREQDRLGIRLVALGVLESD